jgi:hypothetical protein
MRDANFSCVSYEVYDSWLCTSRMIKTDIFAMLHSLDEVMDDEECLGALRNLLN